MLAYNHTLFKRLVIPCVIVAVISLIFVFLRLNHFRKASPSKTASTNQPFLSPETYVVHGKGPLRETHIPFRLKYGQEIVVTALINGEPIECLIDTGCPSILWNSKMHLTQQRTGLQSSGSDAGGHTTSMHEALLDRVQIGGLELRHITSYAMTTGPSEDGGYPILGNSAFVHTVLILDYAKQELIIRPSTANSIPPNTTARCDALDFHWANSKASGNLGVPCVFGKVMSLPANMIIDTGWASNYIGLTRKFYRQLLPQLKASHVHTYKGIAHFTMGKANVIGISHISCSLPGLVVKSQAFAMDDLSPGAQAVLGWSFLRHYRTIIDYPQHKIWFEPIQAKKKTIAKDNQKTASRLE